ncbi:hypothetical protein ACFU5O_11815 [Streptomyces sp. NPDC057445]|uniref:hypothetical protein n=1 Tax=Streptomyces sp. NPDC057445 TaxID=3346136 RepID=UPI0036AFC14D
MSFDIFVCRFEKGEPAPLDMSAAHEVLGPHVVTRDPELNFLQVSTGEGEAADVYLSSPTNITFNRFGGEGVMDLLAGLLRRLDAVLVVPGGTVVLQQEEDQERLPSALKDGYTVVVARTGAEITQAIRAS